MVVKGVPSRRRTILWSPNTGTYPHRCMVGYSDLRTYDWNSQLEGKKAITLVSIIADIPLPRCYAWCPSRELSDLIAIGQNNGRVVLAKLGTNSIEGKQESLFKKDPSHDRLYNEIMDPSEENIRASQWSVLLKREFVPRYSRACNVVIFNPHQPSLLLAGLEKARNDHCLLIWDVFGTGSLSPRDSGMSRLTRDSSAHLVNDDDFDDGISSSSPSAVPVMVSQNPRQLITKPLREFNVHDAVVSAAWSPHYCDVLVVGLANKWIRMFDMRIPEGSSSTISHLPQIQTKAIYGMEMDPFHDAQLASFAIDEPIVRVWDIRKLTEPILELPVHSRSNSHETTNGFVRNLELNTVGRTSGHTIEGNPGILELHYCPSRRGIIGALNIAGDVLTVWNLLDRGSHELSDEAQRDVLMRTHLIHLQSTPISSFSWHTSLDNVIGWVGKNGSVEIRRCFEVPLYVSSKGNDMPLIAVRKQLFSVISTNYSDTDTWLPDSLIAMEQRTIAGYGLDAEHNVGLLKPDSYNLNLPYKNIPLARVWKWMDRCKKLSEKGYSVIGHVDFAWKGLIALLSEGISSAKDTISQTEQLSESTKNTTIPVYFTQEAQTLNPLALTTRTKKSLENDVSLPHPLSMPAYGGICRLLACRLCDWPWDDNSLPIFDPQYSVDALVQEGHHERAAALALFYGEWRSAIQILKESNLETLRLIGMALGSLDHAKDERQSTHDVPPIAHASSVPLSSVPPSPPSNRRVTGMLPTTQSTVTSLVKSDGGSNGSPFISSVNSEFSVIWHEMCAAFIGYLQQPYLRAMFQLLCLKDNPLFFFENEYEQETIRLQDRLALAARFLNDTDLMTFLTRCKQRMISKGELDGILLTGLSDDGLLLIQNYVNRTADVQTACLLIHFAMDASIASGFPLTTSPMVHSTLNQWSECYRELLDRWCLWEQRALFDIMNGRHLHAYGFQTMSRLVPRIIIRCNFCNQSINREGLHSSSGSILTVAPTLNTSRINQPITNEATTANSYRSTSIYSLSGVGTSAIVQRSAPSTHNMTNISSGSIPSDLLSTCTRTETQNTGRTQAGMFVPQSGTLIPSNGLFYGAHVKWNACPHCRKPLPRCAVCLMHLGIVTRNNESSGTVGMSATHPSISPSFNPSLHPLDSWFAWCQNCRHGGHSIHLQEWFRMESRCPVPECTCLCVRLDPVFSLKQQ